MQFGYQILRYLPLLIIFGMLFFFSYKLNIKRPWGFIIILLGVIFSNQGIDFHHDGVTYLSISISFLLTLLGVSWNIAETRSLMIVGDRRKTYFFILISFFYVLIVIPLLKYYSEPTLEISKISFIAIVFLAIQISIQEELLFRGFLFNYLKIYNVNPVAANLIQSLIFTVFHIQKHSDNVILLLEIFIFSLLAGYFTEKSKNLIPAFFMHFFINIFPFILWIIESNLS